MKQTSLDAPVRLRPDMVSLRLHVLRFVRLYIGQHLYSPSQGEIAAALGTCRSRVKDAIRSLEREGLLLRTPGQRGLRMPSERDAAIRVLRALGWTVAEAERMVAPPTPALQPYSDPAAPDFTLPAAAAPAYPASRRRTRRSGRKGSGKAHGNIPADQHDSPGNPP